MITLANIAHKNNKRNCSCVDFKDSSNCDTFNGYVNSLLDREKHAPTAIGYSYGIPHGKCNEVKEPFIVYVNLSNEIEWDEDEMVSNVFMIGVPEDKVSNEYIEILVKLSTSILDDDFRELLDKANNEKEKLEIIKKYAEKSRKF